MLNWLLFQLESDSCLFYFEVRKSINNHQREKRLNKVSSSYHLCVKCFSQLSFDSEIKENKISNSCWFCIHFWIKWELWKTFDAKMIGWTHFTDLTFIIPVNGSRLVTKSCTWYWLTQTILYSGEQGGLTNLKFLPNPDLIKFTQIAWLFSRNISPWLLLNRSGQILFSVFLPPF